MGELTNAARELGRRGGLKTLENKGKSHYRAMAKKRWGKKKVIPNATPSNKNESSLE